MAENYIVLIASTVGFAISTVACIGCIYGCRIVRQRRLEEQLSNQPVTQPVSPSVPPPSYPVPVFTPQQVSYPYMYPNVQQPYVTNNRQGYNFYTSQPSGSQAPSYPPQPSAPQAPYQV